MKIETIDDLINKETIEKFAKKTFSKLNRECKAACKLTLQTGKLATIQATNIKRYSSRIRRPVDRYKPSTYSIPTKTVLNSTKKSRMSKKSEKTVSSIRKAVKNDFHKKVEMDSKENPLMSKPWRTSTSVPFGLDTNLTRVPSNAYPIGYQHDSGIYYAIVSNTDSGIIPGKASTSIKLGWYGYNGKEHYQRQSGYCWLIPAFGCKFALEKSECIPIAAVKSGLETYRNGLWKDLYSGVAHTSYGDIPAKVTGNCECYYTYGGIEHKADNFSWIVNQKTVVE